MAQDALGLAAALALMALLAATPLALARADARKARQAAAALGLQGHEAGPALAPRWDGWLGPRQATVRVLPGLRSRYLAIEARCAAPQGFTLVLGDDAPARAAAGLRPRRLRAVRTGWPHFDGWAWPRSNDEALALAALRRWRAGLTAAPVEALWFHGGRAGVARTLLHLAPGEAQAMARDLEAWIADVEALAADPAARAEALAPDPAPERFGPDEPRGPGEPLPAPRPLAARRT